KFIAGGITLAPGALLASAFLAQSGDITKTQAFRTGQITIQDEASQLVAALVSLEASGESARILDCCAAPGGKTAAIVDRNTGASITAVELHPHRARLMKKLLQGSAPAKQIQIIAADSRDLPFSASFERVLADVPCSGTGTLARNPEIKWRLKVSDLAELHDRQLAILRSAMARVAPKGRLIYSTCSLEKEENEDVIAEALEETKSFRIIDCRVELDRLKSAGELTWPDPSQLTRGPYLRTIPGVHPCDGFFAAILERI
ncbi:MAG TPA: RsmB/NOP family class I SAM-dependent RNA methyltransferase, partial [Candidatus Sulfotelmatobacter sp.]|nr:RsmB/NOP family class I SAM-dependent RNA methyltransferase [Candidatus Sulfotelmatobacter sp.]